MTPRPRPTRAWLASPSPFLCWQALNRPRLPRTVQGNCGLPIFQRSPSSPPLSPFQAPNQLGRLNEIHALWSGGHTTWDVMNNRVVLQSPVCDDDLAALVAVTFKDRIGVMWSDQTGTGVEARDNFGFRFHWDANPDPTSWSPAEIVPLPPRTLIADDHIHLTVTERGDIIAATKASTVATDANGNP